MKLLIALKKGSIHISSDLCWDLPGVDSSASAIRLAEENAALSPETAVARFERAEVEPYMRQANLDGRLWDIVVLGTWNPAPPCIHCPHPTLVPLCVVIPWVQPGKRGGGEGGGEEGGGTEGHMAVHWPKQCAQRTPS